MPVIIYGIRNCDTVKKARAWLDARDVAYRFHDFRADGLDRAMLDKWAEALGWETLLNRSGTTFRKLSEEERSGLDETKALALMQAQPTLVKRPVLDRDGDFSVGFKPALYETLFA